jgi:hypothetical protein
MSEMTGKKPQRRQHWAHLDAAGSMGFAAESHETNCRAAKRETSKFGFVRLATDLLARGLLFSYNR